VTLASILRDEPDFEGEVWVEAVVFSDQSELTGPFERQATLSTAA
jgi:hypothetical protein